MEFSEIIFKVEKGIAVLTLNSPETRNAITGARMIDEIEAACNRVNGDADIRVMILTGTDPAFSSGGNVKDMVARKGMFAGTPSELMTNYRNNVQRIPRAVYNVEVPTIAAVNGPAIGAGLDMALMCDMRVASEKAKFGETFLNVGLIPGDGGAWFLPRVVGMAKACELTFTGEVIDAREALDIRLVNYVTEHERLLEKALELGERIASRPPVALRMAKKLLQMGQRLSMSDLLEQSAAYQALCHHMEDHQEALDAIFEKREPVFSGR